eukprot:m.362123 g.362123  ORF g.362123 m.362123 type:complete len:378 (+) comp20151_c0_seq1:282-1415(+)
MLGSSTPSTPQRLPVTHSPATSSTYEEQESAPTMEVCFPEIAAPYCRMTTFHEGRKLMLSGLPAPTSGKGERRRHVTALLTELDMAKLPEKEFEQYLHDAGFDKFQYTAFCEYLRAAWMKFDGRRLPEHICKLGCGLLQEFRRTLLSYNLSRAATKYLEDERERLMNNEQQKRCRARRCKARRKTSVIPSIAALASMPQVPQAFGGFVPGLQFPPGFLQQLDGTTMHLIPPPLAYLPQAQRSGLAIPQGMAFPTTLGAMPSNHTITANSFLPSTQGDMLPSPQVHFRAPQQQPTPSPNLAMFATNQVHEEQVGEQLHQVDQTAPHTPSTHQETSLSFKSPQSGTEKSSIPFYATKPQMSTLLSPSKDSMNNIDRLSL